MWTVVFIEVRAYQKPLPPLQAVKGSVLRQGIRKTVNETKMDLIKMIDKSEV
jgi:hypothetical protein